MTDSSSGMSWEVQLPRKGEQPSSWGARPKGVLHIESESHGSEAIKLPVAVARSMARKRKAGELDPSSRAELLYHVGQVSADKAAERVASLVDRRDYSTKEAADKLRQDGYPSGVIEAAVGHAVEVGLIDDRRFADVFVRTKVSAGWGQRRIAGELRRRGIEVDDLPGWPYEYLDPEGERERALEVAQRHHVGGKNRRQKMARFLVGRGFSAAVAYDVARETVEDE